MGFPEWWFDIPPRRPRRGPVRVGAAAHIGAVLLSSGRLKGDMTGNRKRAPNEEWLSPFGTGKVQA